MRKYQHRSTFDMRNWDMSIYEEEFMMDVGRPRDTMRQELSLPFRSSRRRFTPWLRDTTIDTIEFEMAQDIEEQAKTSLTKRRASNKRRREMSADLAVDPIKRQQPAHAVCQPVSDPEIPYYQRIGESPDRQQKRVKHDTQTKLLKSNELKDQIDRMDADTDTVMNDDVCVEATSPLPTSLDMRKSIPNSIRKNGKNSLNSVPVPVITPTKTILKTSPFLGPVGWTVPPKTTPQRSKPFLIYQDPQGEDPYRLFEFGSLEFAYAHSHDCSDDKENGPVFSSSVPHSDDQTADVEMDVAPPSMTEDNMVVEAHNIVSMAEANNPSFDIMPRPRSQGDYFQDAMEDDKPEESTPGGSMHAAAGYNHLLTRRQRTDPVLMTVMDTRI